MPIKDVTELEVYQISLKLLKVVYRLAKKVEIYDKDLARVLRKTARQIAPQIHEGYAKKQFIAEFKRFQIIAMGSSDEMVTHLRQVKVICPSINSDGCDVLIQQYIILSKKLNTLIKTWK